MKPSIHEDTLADVEHAIELLDVGMWQRHYRDDWGQVYWKCISCSATHYEMRDGSKPDLTHSDNCRLAEGLPRLRAFANAERQLYNEQDD